MHAPALLRIEDDKALLNGLAETIKRECGYRALVANNGDLSIQLARENLPQLKKRNPE